MNIQKYTEKAQEAIVNAQSMADREGHPEITPEHLLLALVTQEGGIVPEILRKMNVDPQAIAGGVQAELGKNPRAHGGSQPTLSARFRQVTNAAEFHQPRLQRAPVAQLRAAQVSCERTPTTPDTRSTNRLSSFATSFSGVPGPTDSTRFVMTICLERWSGRRVEAAGRPRTQRCGIDAERALNARAAREPRHARARERSAPGSRAA